MFNGKSVIAIVPARGGSKGIPLKNLQMVGGLSLVAHAGRVIQESNYFDRAVVSTDHDKIKEEAIRHGLDAPFTRPPRLSGDRVGDVPVLQHALVETEQADGREYDVVVMLQPTSPLRTPEQVSRTVETLIVGHHDSVWTVSPTDLKYHPLKQLRLKGDQSLEYYADSGHQVIARQQLEQLYHRNGIAYALTRECLMVQGTLLGTRASAVVIDEPTVSIDTEQDIAFAEKVFSECESSQTDQQDLI
jgi:CMP-N-acetylneuraminic acid synthetase